MPERKRKNTGLGSLIGWAIFVLVIAGGPILRALQGALGGAVQLTSWLPYIIGGLMLISLLVSALRAFGGRGDTATQLPERAGPPPEPVRPMPPFGGELGVPPFADVFTDARAPRADVRRTDASAQIRPPRFDPVFPPGVVALGLLGLLVLGGAALAVLGVSLP